MSTPDPLDHPVALDQSIALLSTTPGEAIVPTHPAYWNMIGPYGGWGAAVALRAILDDPRSEGVPIAGSFQFMGPVSEGRLTVRSTPLRVNRSTGFWTAALFQDGADADPDPVVHATVTLARRRDTLAFETLAMPDAPLPEAIAPTPFTPKGQGPTFARNYHHRSVSGGRAFEGGADDHSLVWHRCAAGSPLTYTALIGICDISLPRLFYHLRGPAPISTIAMTVQIHVDQDDIDRIGNDFVLVDTKGRVGHRGYYDQYAHVWSRDGRLLATTDQMVWFRHTG